MAKAGYPVPAWFCVSARVYDDFLLVLKSQIKSADYCEDELFKIFKQSPIANVLTPILHAEISRRGWADQFLAVRSSGLGEDSAGHSFAGQYETSSQHLVLAYRLG